MVVLVTGANGQLGQSLQFVAHKFPLLKFVFCNSKELDITNIENVTAVFKKTQPHYCINAAAYTAVDKAETESTIAKNINVSGVENLALLCKKHTTVLFHISTDFVFDGTKKEPYTETDPTNPIGVYGQTKLEGEKILQATWHKHFIIRTSWVYSQFGHNFLKTMLHLASERDEVSIVNDQIGSPTYAVDLAENILNILTFIEKNKKDNKEENLFGIYNFSNKGICSWYDFASSIFSLDNASIQTHAISTEQYPTPAKRPKFSVLDTTKIQTTFPVIITPWQESLKKCFALL